MKDTSIVRPWFASRHRMAWTIAATAFAVVVASARPANAQNERDAAVRLELLQQAQEARGRGYHARALDLAQRAGAISMTPSLRLFIAEENQSLGRLADAYAVAELCAREADRDQALRNRAAIISSCRELAQSLRPQLGNLIVHVSDPSMPGLRVVVAGAELNHAFIGVPYFVTPGTVPVDVTANGQPPFHAAVQVAAGRDVDVPVTFGSSANAHVEPTHTEPNHTQPTHTEPVATEPEHHPTPEEPVVSTGPTITPPPSTPPARSGAPVPALALMGVGAAGIVAGVVFLTLGQIALHTLSTDCTPPDTNGVASCYPGTMNEVQGAADQVSWTNIAMPVAFGVGGAALVGGLAWWLLGSRHTNDHSRVRVVPILGSTVVGIGGTF